MWILQHSAQAAEFGSYKRDWREVTLISIRKATDEDAGDILTCLAAAFAEYRESYSPGAFRDTVLTAETIAERLREMTLFVATGESGKVVGTIACAVVSEHEGHIRGMAVVPESQGSGIARRLLMQAEAYFRERNCTRISLDTTTPLKRAILVYEKFGFSPSGKVQDFFGMPLMEYIKAV